MEKLWAPWRVELFREPKRDDCFFCTYAKENLDEYNLILERGENCFVVMNRYPYNNGHLMVVPYQHTGEIENLEIQTLTSMMQYCVRWKRLLTESIAPDAFNIGINIGQSAGAGVKDHIHLHLVPRWNGDTNFMPVLGNTKVINQYLTELYQQLKKICQAT